MITLEFLCFSLTFRYTDSVYLGAVVGYLINMFILWIRGKMGSAKLSETALVDERFLL
jgi:hypothetical protein